MPWLKIIRALMIVSRWASKALKDGKITFKEALSLALQLAELLKLETDFNLNATYTASGIKFYGPDKIMEDN